DAALHETCEFLRRPRIGAGAALRVERSKALTQGGQLELPHGRVVDVGRRANGLDRYAVKLRVEAVVEARDIEVDRIEESPVRRMIGASALALTAEQRVQRIDADGRRAQG